MSLDQKPATPAPLPINAYDVMMQLAIHLNDHDMDKVGTFMAAVAMTCEAFCQSPEQMYAWWQVAKVDTGLGEHHTAQAGNLLACSARVLYENGITR